MSAADTRIEYRDGHEGNDWATEALEDSEFERVVDTWFALNTVRFVTAILAWIVASLVSAPVVFPRMPVVLVRSSDI